VTGLGVTTTTTYSYAGLQLLSLSTTATGGTAATATVSYLYDEAGRPFAGLYRGSVASTTVPFLTVTNERGDVVELTDATSNAFAAYSYDAWGNPTARSSAATGSVTASQAVSIAAVQPLRYAGYTYDAFSWLYYCSQRYYDPATYQWISKDPAKADGEESAYQYCGGEPIGRTDPRGEHYFVFNGSTLFVRRSYWSLDWSCGATTGDPNLLGWTQTNGPTPPGRYEVRRSDIQATSGAWGRWRVRLWRRQWTNTFGRDRMYVHGGPWRHTHGCIRVKNYALSSIMGIVRSHGTVQVVVSYTHRAYVPNR
jgi:RHS repeat-associated protein